MSEPRPRPARPARGLGALLLVLCAASALLGVLAPRAARSQASNFAGSIQTNYMYVPTDDEARKLGFDGFTNELSLKVAVDLTDHVSANVKLCYGCHGVEAAMAFVDLRAVDELNFRVGRFTPAFGDFPLRHDPANHRQDHTRHGRLVKTACRDNPDSSDRRHESGDRDGTDRSAQALCR